MLADRIEAVVGAVLLPVFFAFTGLRTSVGLVQGGEAWALTGLVLLVAVAGKFGGSAGAPGSSGCRGARRSPWGR
jgi:Kef-type K+ transport system membrane component KefB